MPRNPSPPACPALRQSPWKKETGRHTCWRMGRGVCRRGCREQQAMVSSACYNLPRWLPPCLHQTFTCTHTHKQCKAIRTRTVPPILSSPLAPYWRHSLLTLWLHLELNHYKMACKRNLAPEWNASLDDSKTQLDCSGRAAQKHSLHAGSKSRRIITSKSHSKSRSNLW